jgi:hypothetical protein
MGRTGELARPTLRASTLPFKASGQNTTESLTKVNCLKELDQIRPAEMHLTFTSPAAMIGIALVIFLISMLIWKKCFGKPDTAESTLPAPLAPPMPASAQPQRHDLLDALPGHTTVTRNKRQFYHVNFSISTAGLTLAT